MFRRIPKEDERLVDTHHLDEIVEAPAFLVDLLGEPDKIDEHKVTLYWAVEEEATKSVLTIYDWKATTAFWGDDADEAIPSPQELREADYPVALNVGGNDPQVVERLVDWLEEEFVEWELKASLSQKSASLLGPLEEAARFLELLTRDGAIDVGSEDFPRDSLLKLAAILQADLRTRDRTDKVWDWLMTDDHIEEVYIDEGTLAKLLSVW